MKIYFLVFIITLFIQFVPVKSDKQYLRRIIITFIPLFLFGALRVNFGLDYPTYEAEFLAAHKYNDLTEISEHSEIGYILLERMIPSWRLLLVFTSAFTCIAYICVFYKCIPSRYSWVAICLLFLAGDKTIFFQFSGIRNAIAIAIMLLAFPLLRDRKFIPYLGMSLLAMCFHTSAIIFMPIFYFVCNNEDMKKKEAWIWVIAMFLLQIIDLGLLFEQVTGFVNTYFDRYNHYAEEALEQGDVRSPLIRCFIAFFVLMSVWFMRTTKLNKDENILCRMSLLYIFAYLLGALNLRISQYLGFTFVCGLTILLSKWHLKTEKNIFCIVTFVYLFYAFFIVWMGRPSFPYHTYHSIFG